jgi:tRNA-intron endonuclease
MQITGELVDSTILVKKPRDVGRLYTKSCFGETSSGNILRLNLIEGMFLLDEQKIKIYHKTKELDFSALFTITANTIEGFEIKYPVFKDLRKRGHMIKLYDATPGITFMSCAKSSASDQTKQCFVSAFSERDILEYKQIITLTNTITQQHGVLWFAIVDEEGDITYYEVTTESLTGTSKKHTYPNGTGLLLDNRVVLFDKPLINQLTTAEFFGKPFGEGLQLSLIEAVYLAEQNILAIKTMHTQQSLSKQKFIKQVTQIQPDINQRLRVYNDLKQRGLIVKTGFKFGAHFRAYSDDPNTTHAEYLIHVVDADYACSCAELSRAVRLAHSVNKEILFAHLGKKDITYLRFGRLRP